MGIELSLPMHLISDQIMTNRIYPNMILFKNGGAFHHWPTLNKIIAIIFLWQEIFDFFVVICSAN